MFGDRYLSQVRLLLSCLPELARQPVFALKGGTAINLFVRDLPQISVDIDLTYLPLKPREEALPEISVGLHAIGKRMVGCVTNETVMDAFVSKLQISDGYAEIIIEPNLVFRGAVYKPEERALVLPAQHRFEAYVAVPTLSEADLYGSKLCAALDRQHPRDLFDVKQLLDADGLTADVRRAFVVYLAGHPRPISELLDPRIKDIEAVFRDQFMGMTTEPVTLDELIDVQRALAGQVREALDENEKAFLLSVKQGEPEWDLLGIEHLNELPALQWKVINVRKMDEGKRAEALTKLERVLGGG